MSNVIPFQSRTLDRDWWVVSVVMQEVSGNVHGALLVKCTKTGVVGNVYALTEEEFDAACDAEEKPYKWADCDRVWIAQEELKP